MPVDESGQVGNTGPTGATTPGGQTLLVNGAVRVFRFEGRELWAAVYVGTTCIELIETKGPTDFISPYKLGGQA